MKVAKTAKSAGKQSSGAEGVATEILRCRTGRAAKRETDQLATEEPLEIRVRGQSVAVTITTHTRS